jgi:hypothetical protein
MERVLKNLEKQDLGGNEVGTLLTGVARVTTYDTIVQTDDIVELLSKDPKIALLFPVTTDTDGHWLGIFADLESKTITHFDPYGLSPRAEMRYTNIPEVVNTPLTNLYQKAESEGWNIIVSDTKLQEMEGGVNTCGRHVIVRLRMSYLSVAEYAALMMKQKMKPDDLVTLMTFLALNEDEQDNAQVVKVLTGGSLPTGGAATPENYDAEYSETPMFGGGYEFNQYGQIVNTDTITPTPSSQSGATSAMQQQLSNAAAALGEAPPPKRQRILPTGLIPGWNTSPDTLPVISTFPPGSTRLNRPAVPPAGPAPAPVAPATPPPPPAPKPMAPVVAPPAPPAPANGPAPYEDPETMQEVMANVLYVLKEEDAASDQKFAASNPLLHYLGVMDESDIQDAGATGVLSMLNMNESVQQNMVATNCWKVYQECEDSPNAYPGQTLCARKGDTPGQFFVWWLAQIRSNQILDDVYTVFYNKYYTKLSELTPVQLWNPQLNFDVILRQTPNINWHGLQQPDPRFTALRNAVQQVRQFVRSPYEQYTQQQDMDRDQEDEEQAQTTELNDQDQQEEDGGGGDDGGSSGGIGDILGNVLSMGLDSLF